MPKECTCDEWNTEIDILNSVIIFADIYNMNASIEPFKYCPYCGEELILCG